MEPDFQAVYGTLIENCVSTPSIKMAALAVGALVDGSSKNSEFYNIDKIK